MRSALTARERHLAAEIAAHDWAAAPHRAGGAARGRPGDEAGDHPRLAPEEAERVRANVMWVVAQCLGYEDPELPHDAFAAACGVTRDYRCTPFGGPSTIVREGLRIGVDGAYDVPGSTPARPRGGG